MGKRFKAEEIVMNLREIELSQSRGLDIPQACRQAGISEQSYYRWRKEYGGMKLVWRARRDSNSSRFHRGQLDMLTQTPARTDLFNISLILIIF